MAAVARNPLSMRPQTQFQSTTPSPFQATARRLSSAKRARSPEPAVDVDVSQSSKRFKPVAESPAPNAHRSSREEVRKDRERLRERREQDFRIKYTRAFPNWVFYFDLDTFNSDIAAMRDRLVSRVMQMGAHVDDFFSKDITHLITLQGEEANKENISQPVQSAKATTSLGSPIRLRGRAANDAPGAASENLVKKALAFDIKVWSFAKLENILDRCRAPAPRLTVGSTKNAPVARAPAAGSKERSLTRLLETERLYGTTERDPTQRRHGYTYFSKNTYFVLVEDMRQELATIAALEYPITKGRDGRDKGTWPVLYCHPRARGPFIPYDDREERRRDKADRLDREREREMLRRKARMKEEERRWRTLQAHLQAKQHDLRRSVSMNNLQRRATYPDPGLEGYVDLDADTGEVESANCSGYLASGAYMAASGNSVGVTSTTGTTSAAGNGFRNLQLPTALKGRLQQQVVTSRKIVPVAGDKENKMGPPPTIPHKPNVLKKSRSTNTLKLPEREEGQKPGYCESCRVKFEDFEEHIEGRRHQKFAMDDSNFAQLDEVLSRVRRRTLQEVEAEKRSWASRFDSGYQGEEQFDDEDATMLPMPDPTFEDDVRWDDWVDADGM